MYRHMCILQCQKVEIEPPKFFWKWKKQVSFLLFSTVSLIMSMFILLPFLIICIWIRYQKSYILVSDNI
jgi:hypothetical protein